MRGRAGTRPSPLPSRRHLTPFRHRGSGMKKAAALLGAGPASPGASSSSSVPGFLAKLWALVEDPGSDDVISWSRNGQNFCILDEQRFAKELLPKYFKHNNLSSFIRQLNIYGFRKVIALENGMITSDKNPAIEFQHPFFKRGQFDLLANIKRKSTLSQVATVRPEDLKICPDDLHKVLSEVQEMREQQNSMDIKLESMKRENKALWKEVVCLRQKHNQQQQLLSKILEFILGLMRGNCILGVKRKRSLADASDPSPAKYSRQYVRIPVEDCETTDLLEHGPDCQDSIIIRDITDAQEEEEEAEDAAPEKFLALVHSNHESWKAPVPTREGIPTYGTLETSEPEVPQGDHSVQLTDGLLQSSAVELHTPQISANEEAAAVIDSIINENQTMASSDSFLDREEIQDFLNCIDASLEELQAMLSGKKTHHASEALTDTFSPELPVLDSSIPEAPLRLEQVDSGSSLAPGRREGGEQPAEKLVNGLQKSKEETFKASFSLSVPAHDMDSPVVSPLSFPPLSFGSHRASLDGLDSANWSKTLVASTNDLDFVSGAQESCVGPLQHTGLLGGNGSGSRGLLLPKECRKLRHGLPLFPELVLCRQPVLASWRDTVAGQTEDLPANLDTDGIKNEETSGKNDMQLIQYRGNPLLSLFEEPPSSEEDSHLGNARGHLLGPMESNEAAQRVTSPESQMDGALDQPLLSEDMNGEYKLFPLLLLSPVANFIEEASEIETT
ncbi:hypothetical protein E2320_012828 [Naja naja]|nr:hypothetical protein E2320_012828 [Naja naja]